MKGFKTNTTTAAHLYFHLSSLSVQELQRDTGSIPGSGRSPGEGNGNPLQHSCLENPMDRGAWWATVHRVTESRAWLSDCVHTYRVILVILSLNYPSCLKRLWLQTKAHQLSGLADALPHIYPWRRTPVRVPPKVDGTLGFSGKVLCYSFKHSGKS